MIRTAAVAALAIAFGVGASTLGACGQRRNTTGGLSDGSTYVTVTMSAAVILPVAKMVDLLMGRPLVAIKVPGSPATRTGTVDTVHPSRCRDSDITNLTLVCRYHHHNFLGRGWSCQIGDDGLPWWRPPRWLDPDQRPVLNTRIRLAHLHDESLDDEGVPPAV
jgi:hypothetical protein